MLQHVPLEDRLGDVLGKASRGLQLPPIELAAKTGIDLSVIESALEGSASPDTLDKLAPLLHLHSPSLRALAADATLLAPAGPAFSIWSIIYIGLAAYTIWQWFPANAVTERTRRTGWLIAVSMLPKTLARRLALIGAGLERTIQGHVAAVSVGIVEGMSYLDLDYSEDSRAEVDFNVVGTDAGTYVELQGTAEGKPFDRAAVDRLLDLADEGLRTLFAAQAEALAKVPR